jgi:NADPH2:quinone reductase
VREAVAVKRAILHEFGAYSNLQFEELPDPVPGDNEVLVAIEAAGVGFVDTLCVRGVYQLLPSLPWVPGCELAGHVAAVGEGVTGIDVGDRVLATSFAGSYQSHTVLRPEELVAIPGSLTAGQAAGLVASYGTMLYALTRRITVAPGEWVVVLGAGGGVGLASIDIAKYRGARVIACASTSEKLDLAARAGADVTVNYEDPGVDLKAAVREITGGGADVIVDPVGGDKSAVMLRALGFEGRYVLVGFASGVIPDVPLNQVLLNDRTVVGVDWGLWAGRRPEVNAELLGELFDLVRAGALCPTDPVAYALADAATALDDLEHRRVAGKVVLVP